MNVALFIGTTQSEPFTEIPKDQLLQMIDEDLDEFSAWVETEMSGPVRAPLHPSERAIIKTYLVRKLLPDLVRTRTS
jgi:mono/diheme cytochrome c family protein